MKVLLFIAWLAASLAGCAHINAQTRSLLASKVPAYAAINGVLFAGTATLFTDRTGTVQLTSSKAPDQVCSGPLHYTATAAGMLVLHCTGTMDTVVNFRAISDTSGFGYGSTAQGTAATSWGMSAANAAAYLGLRPLDKEEVAP